MRRAFGGTIPNWRKMKERSRALCSCLKRNGNEQKGLLRIRWVEDGFRYRLDALSYELVELHRESELVTSIKKKRRGTVCEV